MSLFRKIFGGGDSSTTKKRKKQISAVLKISQINRLTADAVKITFDVPLLLKEQFYYSPGQYLNLVVEINGKEEHRSYSICSDVGEPLAVGVKKIESGVVSSFFNDEAKVGTKIKVSSPIGKFVVENPKGNFVAIAAGSGITPILSIAKMLNRTEGSTLQLIYGNRGPKSIMFEDELNVLAKEKINITHVFSEQEVEGVLYGALTEEVLTGIISDKSEFIETDGFYICGPEPVIVNAKNVLKKLGIPDKKIFFELFDTPVLMKDTSPKVKDTGAFKGVSKVTVILDGEEEVFKLSTKGDTILEEAESHGLDAPYSCRGGICSTCKAKVLKGEATMDKNFTLSEEEIKEGYILTCQAHPNSEEITVSYDE